MKLVSLVLHPLLLCTYVFGLFYLLVPELFSPIPLDSIPYVLVATFVTTFVIPVLSIGALKLTSRIGSVELTKKEERILPFISIAMFYAAATYMLVNKLMVFAPLSTAMITVSSLIIILFLITIKYKISIHAAAMWGVCGIFTALSMQMFQVSFLYLLTASFICAGLVSTSRLSLNVHTPGEVWSGAFLGFAFCFLSLIFR
jgi:hypothetical protein